MVYFIQAEIGGPVKIGYTSCPVEARLKSLQCGSPFKLRVLGVLGMANQKEERRLHREFEHYRVHGEWFNLDGVDFSFRNLHKILRTPDFEIDPPRSPASDKPRTLPGRYWPLARRVMESLQNVGPATAKELRARLGIVPTAKLGGLYTPNKLVPCLQMLNARGWVGYGNSRGGREYTRDTGFIWRAL